MKYPNMDWGRMEAVINKLGGMQGVELFLEGKTSVVSSTSKCVLKGKGSVNIPANESVFVADETFLKRENREKFGFVLHGNFRLGSKTEGPCSLNRDLSVRETCGMISPLQVLIELGGWEKVEVGLACIYFLLTRQKAGSRGVLGGKNVFFVADEGVRYAVFVTYNRPVGCDEQWVVASVPIEEEMHISDSLVFTPKHVA